MPKVNKYPPGTFCWTELATSDPKGAKTFYNTVFGWDHQDDPIPGGMVNTMLQQSGGNVGALYEINEEMKAHNVPPHWLQYISVASVDDTVAKATELGAQVPRPGMDVMDIGRMAVLVDPAAAHFAIWEPKKAIGANVVNEPGAPLWNELMTTNVEAAGGFYTKLFDWGSMVMPMPTGDYTVFKNGERPAGGMMAITPEMPDMPPAWVVYFAVADAADTTKKVEAAGGTVLQPPTPVPNVGTMAAYLDPQGAGFAVMQGEHEAQDVPEDWK